MRALDQKTPAKDLRQQLEELLAGRVRLMGLGNVDLCDDGFGVYLAQQLLEAGVPEVIVAETTPERYIGRVEDEGFDRLVFLDAVDLGAAPGSVVLLNARQICDRYPQISTHKISLGVLAQWVQATGKTKVWLLGVQPESLCGPGFPNSAETRDATPSAGDWQERCPKLTPTISATLKLLRDLILSVKTRPTRAGTAGPAGSDERNAAVGVAADEAITAC